MLVWHMVLLGFVCVLSAMRRGPDNADSRVTYWRTEPAIPMQISRCRQLDASRLRVPDGDDAANLAAGVVRSQTVIDAVFSPGYSHSQ